MDFEKIITELELGKPLSKIAKEMKVDLSTIYKKMRNDKDLQERVRRARETGCFTIIDKINEELEIPVDNQQMMWMREKLHQARWLASKLASGVFGEKSKQEIKTDNKISISWGKPSNEINKAIEKTNN